MSSPPDQVRRLERAWVDLVRSLAARSVLAGFDLGPAQYHALTYVSEMAPVRMGELAAALRVAESSATRVVDRLVSEGLLERMPDPSDRRTVRVALTAKGRGLLAKVRRRRSQTMAELLDALDPSERDQLVELFEKLAAVQL
jgi:DNA-binding MarR family transcriptional regulator